jgi:hypothetical protein
VTGAADRRLLAEFTGTGLVVAVVVGAGIPVTRLTGDAGSAGRRAVKVTSAGSQPASEVISAICARHE